MRRLKVLLLPFQEIYSPWCDDVIAAVGERHDLAIYDKTQPIVPQFEGIETVIDQGGSVGTREMMDVAKDVKFWQILGTGFEHFDLEYIKQKGIMVANCPGQFSSVALAETAMMFILMLGHQYRDSFTNFQKGVMYQPLGIEVDRQTLGIIGFGASGQDLAIRASNRGIRSGGNREDRPWRPRAHPDYCGSRDKTSALQRSQPLRSSYPSRTRCFACSI